MVTSSNEVSQYSCLVLGIFQGVAMLELTTNIQNFSEKITVPQAEKRLKVIYAIAFILTFLLAVTTAVNIFYQHKDWQLGDKIKAYGSLILYPILSVCLTVCFFQLISIIRQTDLENLVKKEIRMIKLVNLEFVIVYLIRAILAVLVVFVDY